MKKIILINLFIFLGIISYVNISFGWDKDTLSLLQQLGDRKYYYKCNFSMDIIEKLYHKNGEIIYNDVFEKLKKENPPCVVNYGLWLLKKKDNLAIDCIIYYMNPEWSESFSEGANYRYYWDILAMISNGLITPRIDKGVAKNGEYYEFKVYPRDSYEKIKKWWEENKSNYKFTLTDEEIKNIFQTIKENENESIRFYKKLEKDIEKREKERTIKLSQEKKFIEVIKVINYSSPISSTIIMQNPVTNNIIKITNQVEKGTFKNKSENKSENKTVNNIKWILVYIGIGILIVVIVIITIVIRKKSVVTK